MELDEIELELETLYDAHPEEMRRVISPDDLPRVWKRYGASQGNISISLNVTLPESEFFQRGEDIAVMRHKRFLPPIRHQHSFFEIMYVAHGACINHVGDETCSLHKGDICILSPGTPHAVSCFDRESVLLNILVRKSSFETTFFNVLSDRDILSRFFGRALLNKDVPSYIIFQTGEDEQIATLLHFLDNEFQEHEDYKNRMMANILQGFFILLLRHHNQSILLPKEIAPDREDNIFAILNYIQVNYADLTMERLSAHFGYSTRHMARIIKSNVGVSFGNLVKTAKLNAAAKMLENPNNSMTDVIQRTGYADLSGFHRAFKQHFGKTPAEFRRENAHQSFVDDGK